MKKELKELLSKHGIDKTDNQPYIANRNKGKSQNLKAYREYTNKSKGNHYASSLKDTFDFIDKNWLRGSWVFEPLTKKFRYFAPAETKAREQWNKETK